MASPSTSTMPNIRNEPVSLYTVHLTLAEHAMLTKSARCNSCGHLLALHGDYDRCCSVDECQCHDGVWQEQWNIGHSSP